MAASHPIGIVIPTFNRIDTLRLCLEHLERQTWQDFEVVVVDDGSTDATLDFLREYEAHAPFAFRYVHQANSGPARARNRGVQQLDAAVCLLLGDDILATPELVRLHLEQHRSHPGTDAAALGLTRWSQHGQIVTPFMQWLDDSDAQFGYKALLAGEAPGWKDFYTSNLSLKTAQLRRHPFDERFRRAAMEDIELGYRLALRGELSLSFLPDAIADHLHPTTFRQACRRMVGVGESVYLFGELWPDRREKPIHRAKRAFRSVLHQPWVLARLTDLADLWTDMQVPNRLMVTLLSLHATLGYEQAGKGARSTIERERQALAPVSGGGPRGLA